MRGRGFEYALSALKAGLRTRRTGWNGKGMWLQVVTGIQVNIPRRNVPTLAHNEVFDPDGHRYLYDVALYPRHIAMKTATGELVPWLSSITDLMAEDWEVVK